MTWTFKCKQEGCNATLMTVVSNREEVAGVLIENGWLSALENGVDYPSWSEKSAPAFCPLHRPTYCSNEQQLLSALRWTLDWLNSYIEEETGKQGYNPPRHQCDHIHNPITGRCSICDKYFDALKLAWPDLGLWPHDSP